MSSTQLITLTFRLFLRQDFQLELLQLWLGKRGAKSIAAGLAAAATSTGVAVGNSIKSLRRLQRTTPVVNNMHNSNSGNNTNSNVNSGNPDYSVHSSLEEGDSISNFMVSIYQFLLGWMKDHDPNRLPSNTDGIVFDLSSYNFLFTSFNLIVYLMFTAVLYYIFIGFVQLSLKYFNNILSEIGNRNGVVYISSAMEKMIVITKVMLVLVFVFTMTCSVFLYIYYHLPVDLAKHLNSTMITQYSKSTDYTIGYYTVGISFYYFQKFYTIVITCILGFYRTRPY